VWTVAGHLVVALRIDYDFSVPSQLKHLLLCTTENPYDQSSWSGIPYSLRAALERQVERLSVFRPGPPRRTPLNVVKRVWHGGSPPKYQLWMTDAALKRTAQEVQAEIERVKPEAVLSISSQCLIHLPKPGIPVFMFSDTDRLTWHELYKQWDPMPLLGPKYVAAEARAARRIDGLCFGSRWACDEAERVFSTPKESVSGKLHVTPLGANWVPAMTRDEIMAKVAMRTKDEIELLYIGRDWERKGGPMAVEVAQLLRNGGQKVRLHVVGCRPELPAEMIGPEGFVTVHGLLRQNDAQESAVLAELFLRSHFLIVPTTAECFGIVFAEAQAFGLPPISRAVDALPSVILDGETGLLFERTASASAYVERILALMADRSAYEAMARRARMRFEEVLNWDATAAEMVRLFSEKLAEG
jgi:glycosyltransferase involved in cell wall biosynthesis